MIWLSSCAAPSGLRNRSRWSRSRTSWTSTNSASSWRPCLRPGTRRRSLPNRRRPVTKPALCHSVGQLYAFARIELGLSDAEFWSQTFHETDLLAARWRIQQAREDRRAALTAWILASVHRDSESRSEPFTFEEVVAWLGHGFQPLGRQETPPQPATADDLLAQAKMLNTLYGGTEVNGSG